MLRKCPMPLKPTPQCTACAPPSCRYTFHPGTGMSTMQTRPPRRVSSGWCLHTSAQACRGITYQSPAVLEPHTEEDTGKWPGLFPITASQQEGLSVPWMCEGLLCWGEAARGVSVTTHSDYQEAKAVLARSCGYLLWHKIQITLFVLKRDQNLTLT